MIGIVDFSTPRGLPCEAILDARGSWHCPQLPVLDRVLNLLHAPDPRARDLPGGDFGRAELRNVAAWLRGSVRPPAHAKIPALGPFETARLRAEPLDMRHLEAIYRLHRDPAVMRTLSADGLPMADESTRLGVEAAVDHWRRHGFGFWAFFERPGGRFVGRGGLKVYPIDEREHVGLAYAVVADRWRLGYGTEIAAASLDAAFGPLGLGEVASWTLPINRASRGLMEKLGFRYDRDILFAGLTHRFYRLSAGDWRRRGRELAPARVGA